ncbi:AI-2E family transporter [Actinokineospora globicatena]|uniref:AI-2E family transporter n=1 Tax=Actinokineospora globicatena TaxID=103729 RepID=A0A9W6QHA5_9PSEU|nr:AI-2E family transporter [Actinokineospora globicatena]GLW90056.1 AI-2E family transporter [Actinokineospora globicatena]
MAERVDATGLLPRGLVILLGCASVVVVVAGLRTAAWLVAPALLALMIVVAIAPVHHRLRRRGVKPWVATTATVVVVYGVLIAVGLVVVASVAQLSTLLPGYADRGRQLVVSGADLVGRIVGDPNALREAVDSVDPVRMLSSLGSLLGGVAGLTTNLVFLLALLFFLAAETSGAGDRLAAIASDRPELVDALRDVAARTRRYLAVTTLFGLLIAVVDTVALAIIGVPLALLWGLLSFVTNYIPNIGFLLGLAPPVLLALLGEGPKQALVVCAVYVIVNFIVQSLIQPRVTGDAVGLSATTAFVALIFWGWVLGPLGMLLAVPVTLLAGALLVDIDPRAGWVGALLWARSRTGSSAPEEATERPSDQRDPRETTTGRKEPT